jgi:hypothetical protein
MHLRIFRNFYFGEKPDRAHLCDRNKKRPGRTTV